MMDRYHPVFAGPSPSPSPPGHPRHCVSLLSSLTAPGGITYRGSDALALAPLCQRLHPPSLLSFSHRAASSPYPPSSSSLSNSYNHCPSLYSSTRKSNALLFPLAAQAHTADLVSQVPRGNLQPALLFGDQPQRHFCGSELEHAQPRWDF